MKLANLNDELKRLFPADGSDAPWRVADKAIFALSPKDRITVLNLYCRGCGERKRLDVDYEELPCACPIDLENNG